jgi:hypothetical protein
VRYVTRDNHRLYVHPQTGEFIKGVTSIIDNLPKPFLKAWGQKLVAEEAVGKLTQLTNLAGANPEAAVDWLKKAPNRFTAHSAKVGKEAHGVFEELSLGNNPGKLDPELQVYADHFKDYLDTLQPEPVLLEEGVYDEEHDYAGTFDAIMRYNQPDLLIRSWDAMGVERVQPLVGVAWQDNKTTRSGVHPEVGLQLSAYRHAKYIIKENGELALNRPGDFALVLHVRPEGWELVPVEAGPAELDVFLHLRAISDYVTEGHKRIIHAPIAGNRVRRARRRASAESQIVLPAEDEVAVLAAAAF